MSLQTAEDRILDLIDGSELCSRSGKWLPALSLSLMAIDTMAWLSRPLSAPKVKPEHFVAWCDAYLHPLSNLACTSLELYAFRCGLLHTQSPRSRYSESAQARRIFLVGTPEDEPTMHRLLAGSGEAASIVVVPLTTLLEAIHDAANQFCRDLKQNPSLAKLAGERSAQLFAIGMAVNGPEDLRPM